MKIIIHILKSNKTIDDDGYLGQELINCFAKIIRLLS